MFANALQLTLFVLYLLLNIGLGIWVARRQTAGTRDYFLSGGRLPWYAIGASIIAANISTEHFIGMVGMAYTYGFMLAHWEWGNFITFSILIWVFLPFYIRGGLYTMPEFLERRYNRTCRYLFAVASLILWIVAQMAAVMLAGAVALEGMFNFDPVWTILLLAVLAGSYTIYGGLISVAWTDFLQFVVMLLGGLVVAVVGLAKVGGPLELFHAMPEKIRFVYPATHDMFPWFGVYTAVLSIGIWYSCTNQFMVQRCLGAKNEWHARMGVLFAGYTKLIMPFLVVIPGLVAYKLYPDMAKPDEAFPTLVKDLVPAGLGGIVMAGLFSSLMSHLSSVLNSCSTVFTMDLYKPLFARNRDDRHLVAAGRVSALVILVGATVLGVWFTHGQHRVFYLIQNVGAWVAPPIAVLFLFGVFWRRATSTAAVVVLLFGFPYTWFVEHVLFKNVGWLAPYGNWLNRTFVVWISCIAVMIVVSLLTKAPDPASLKGLIWSWQVARMPESEREHNRGIRNLGLWYAIFMAIIAVLYGYTLWFQFWGPGSSTSSGAAF